MSDLPFLDLLSDTAVLSSSATLWLRLAALGAALALLLVISIIDARHRIIPDEANAALAVLGLSTAFFGGTDVMVAAAVQGGVAFGLFWLFQVLYRLLRGVQGLGFGDVKFMGAAGIWVGLGGVAPLILVACLAALAFVAVAKIRGEAITGRYALPFGPFLALGLAVMLVADLWLSTAA